MAVAESFRYLQVKLGTSYLHYEHQQNHNDIEHEATSLVLKYLLMTSPSMYFGQNLHFLIRATPNILSQAQRCFSMQSKQSKEQQNSLFP